jgi:hypothetical protein
VVRKKKLSEAYRGHSAGGDISHSLALMVPSVLAVAYVDRQYCVPLYRRVTYISHPLAHMISSVLAGGLCRSPALWVDLICVGGWLMSLASTVGSLLAVTTPAPLYNTVLAGANCVRQHANFHVSAQNISGLVAGAAMPSSFTEEPRSSGLVGPGDNL